MEKIALVLLISARVICGAQESGQVLDEQRRQLIGEHIPESVQLRTFESDEVPEVGELIGCEEHPENIFNPFTYAQVVCLEETKVHLVVGYPTRSSERVVDLIWLGIGCYFQKIVKQDQ